MQKIVFEDTTIVKAPYVEIDGVQHEVHDGEYQGGTDLNATTFNTMQNNIETAINGVVESGSNSNGEWIKFDDGTMICHKKITLNNVGFTYQQGSLYFCPLQQLGNMPQTFTQLYGVFENLSSGYGLSQGVKSAGNSSFGYIQYFRAEQGDPQTLVIDVMAIGKWN